MTESDELHTTDAAPLVRIITPMTREMVAAIDDYRYARRVPSRSEAIRRLLRRALEIPEAEPRGRQPRPRPGKWQAPEKA